MCYLTAENHRAENLGRNTLKQIGASAGAIADVIAFYFVFSRNRRT
jgi:hypothetical protein